MGKTNKILLFVGFLLLGCQEEEPVIVEAPTISKVDIAGYVQKGPFINGTSVTIVELNDSLGATGKTFLSQVVDNKGSFSAANIELSSPYVQLMADGFYFDEVKGEKSVAQLTLFALADTASAQQINVNVLSHLEKDRILYLIGQGKSFAEAKQQAQREILSIFGIAKEAVANAETLDISKQGEDNAILLAISAVLQGDNTVAELSELLAEISADIRTDGTLESEAIKTELKHNAIRLNLVSIRHFVQQRYAELGVETTIPAFEHYIDSDGDAILNKDDDSRPDDFVFEAVQQAKRNATYTSQPITLSGLPSPTIAKIINGILLKNGQPAEDEFIYVANGDKLQVKLQSPLGWGEKGSLTLQVGNYTTSFTVTNEVYPWAGAISGFVQEGPFINGSSLTATELDSALTETQVVYTTRTKDSRGSYQFDNVQFNYPWTLLQAKGYYFNMITGKSSEGELELIGYTDISSTDSANINVLTHLESRRVKYLLNTGMSFQEAKQQALKEVLSVFEIDEAVTTTAEHFSLTRSNAESAILVAVSAILQGYENTGALSALLTNISIDLETDGKLDDGILGSALVNNAYYLDLPAIRLHLTNRYEELGETVQIPDFEKYVKQFVSNTDYTLTNKITYPNGGFYGKNLLADEANKYKKGNYGLYVTLPVGAKIKIKISSHLDFPDNLAWSFAPNDDWVYTEFNTENQSRIFTATKTGEVKLEFYLSGNLKIEIFEHNDKHPTRIKNITVF